MEMRRVGWLIFPVFLCGLCGLARVPLFAEEPAFVAHTAGGGTPTGTLQQLGPGWAVRFGGKESVRDLLTLRRTDKPLPPPPTGEQLVFVNGDRVAGRVRKLADEQIHFQFTAELEANKEARVPLSALSVIWLATPDGVDQPDLFRRRLAAGQRQRDTLLLRNGDALEGLLGGFDDAGVQMEVDKKSVPVPRSRIAAVALSTELTTPLRPKGVFGRLILAGGSRLSLADAACEDGKTLTGTTLFDAPVRVPLEQVLALDIYQGKAVPLSELKPLKQEQTPYLGVSWPLVNDGSVAGRDLRLGGSSYDKGLGMHSESRVTYDVSAGYRRFEALVGLDDQTGRDGSVRIKVLVDGKPRDVGWDKELTAQTGPQPVRVDLAGAKQLTLVVEFGQRGDVGDHIDWVDARLVR
jgi:hypothetical protein